MAVAAALCIARHPQIGRSTVSATKARAAQDFTEGVWTFMGTPYKTSTHAAVAADPSGENPIPGIRETKLGKKVVVAAGLCDERSPPRTGDVTFDKNATSTARPRAA